MLAHNVFFTLLDSSPAAIESLLGACRKYLTPHEGIAFFACGTLSDLDRPVNVRDFHVGLHIIFESREAHDAYQKAPLHKKLVEEHQASWAEVRVFDTDCPS